MSHREHCHTENIVTQTNIVTQRKWSHREHYHTDIETESIVCRGEICRKATYMYDGEVHEAKGLHVVKRDRKLP